jgi:hypothetical protein
MSLAPAFAAHGSGRFQSCGTEIGLALRGYAGAVLALSTFQSTAIAGTGTGPNACPGSLMMGWGAEAASSPSGRVAGAVGGDLSPAGLESPDRRDGESGRKGGAN